MSESLRSRELAALEAEADLVACSERWLEKRPLGVNPILDEELSQATLRARRASRRLVETRRRLERDDS